jgi:P-type Cu+ transporter
VALRAARETEDVIRQNLWLAFVFNGFGIPLAALGLLTPAVAGAAMAASSVSVVLNAARLSRRVY